jgi:glycerol-3-phosphate dehydrogenase subunit B
VAGLPVSGFSHRMGFFTDRFLDDQPLGLAGVAVDDQLRPLDEAGNVAMEGVRCIGGLLADHDPTAEGSREGVALTTATRAAELLTPSHV